MAGSQSAKLVSSVDYRDRLATSFPQAIERLVEELSQVCSANSSIGCQKEFVDGDELLLDVEVGSLHCVLVRHTPKNDLTAVVALSPREVEIARMIARGYPNKIIAAVLDISCWTVGTHIRHLFAKLHVTSRAAMVAELSKLGLLEAPKKQLSRHE